MSLYQGSVENVMTCGNRCMCREYGVRCNCFHGAVEVDIAIDNEFPAAFQYLECCVTFVDMPDSRVEPQRAFCLNPSDAQQYFLQQSIGGVASIELVGDVLVLAAICRDVTVE